MKFTEAIPLSLYIHLPWCIKKCPYCDFNSHATSPAGDFPQDQYIDALLQDLQADLPLVWGRRINTIFIGGGTPSLFSVDSLQRLLSRIRALLPVAADAEITLEANPGAAEQTRFDGYREIGINRISLGIQSFSDASLQALGRVHDGENAQAAIGMAQQAGFDNINLDVMHGLPGQTLEMAVDDLQRALSFNTTHLSYYQLTIEPNTQFNVSKPELPSEDVLATIEQAGGQLLADAGFERYEVSAYAQSKRRQCAHNNNYWQFGDYLGIGAGAHAKLSFPAEDQIRRYWKHRQPEHYMQQSILGSAVGGQKMIPADEVVFEFMLNALRLVDGFTKNTFLEHTGLPWDKVDDIFMRLQSESLIEQKNGYWKLSHQGFRYLDTVTQQFLP